MNDRSTRCIHMFISLMVITTVRSTSGDGKKVTTPAAKDDLGNVTFLDGKETAELPKRLGAFGALAATVGAVSGAIGMAREDYSDTSAPMDLASAEGLPDNITIDVTELGEYTGEIATLGSELRNTNLADFTDPDAIAADEKPFDGYVFYQAGEEAGDNADNLVNALEQAGHHYDAIELTTDQVDLGNVDFLIAREIDATSLPTTLVMMGMICIAVMLLTAFILKCGPSRKMTAGPILAVATATGLAFGGLMGGAFHFRSAENMGGEWGCMIGVVLLVIIAAVLYGKLLSKQRGDHPVLTPIGHALSGLALVGGVAMLTNLAGESVGENAIDRAVFNVFESDIDLEAGQMGGAAFVGCFLLVVGLFWLLKTVFQSGDNKLNLMDLGRSGLLEKVILLAGAAGTGGLLTLGFSGIASETLGAQIGGFAGAAVLFTLLAFLVGKNYLGIAVEKCVGKPKE